MTIEKRTFLYEVLVRFDANGFAGAHQIHAEHYYDTATGQIATPTTLGDAQPLDRDLLAPLLGEQFTAMAEELRQTQERLRATQSAFEALSARVAAAPHPTAVWGGGPSGQDG